VSIRFSALTGRTDDERGGAKSSLNVPDVNFKDGPPPTG
jgi:hypothetical protein